jgi:pullulanase/glycogen debranching enzyme
MKKITLLLLFISSISFSQVQDVTFSASPATFEENEEITITVSNINLSTWGVTDIYLWAWSFDANDENIMDSPTNGSWTNSNESQKLTNNGNGTYSFTFTPTSFYNRTGIGKIGMLVKAKDGSGDKKSQDQLFEIGKFQLTLNTPNSSTTIINSGDNVNISASTSLPANFNLKANGVSVDQQTNITNYTFSPAVTENTTYILEATNNGTIDTVSFNIIVKPTVTEANLPSGLKDGINLNTSDNTKATLVFFAPDKEFIHVIGDFNNWEINNTYLLKKDASNNRFWIELSNLTPQTNHTYQYLIDGEIRVADPYSTVVLTESNDQYINATTYPSLPEYPTGKTNHAVTLLRTGDTDFNWQTTNYEKPKKTDLVIYELLIRDFDELHSFDAVKARLDYLQGLGINAIEFMPLNEFDGNESWGYNPSFHMALDKYYGTRTAFKQLVDECHRRGIAIIVDIVFNHGTGQNPYYRMWNTDNGNYGGAATANNPFFNETAKHPFNVFNDMNHSSTATKDYVKRITQYWIEEYKVDGFRWDLSKGFTQQATTDVGAWGQYQSERVAILKEYADYQWEKDPSSYVILEHFAANSEETELINYKLSEGKGLMVWGNHHGNYKEAALGNHDNNKSDFSWISYKNRSWSQPQNVSYMVSHDEERLMYENINNGNANATYNTKNLSTALDRMELNGAFYFTVPGPKMIWQFDELGYDISINQNGRTGNKPILWNYFENQDRKDIYNTWNKLIQLKLKYDIFETSTFTIDANNSNGLKKIQLTDDSASEIQYINVIGNFGLTTQNMNPVFQKIGVWYNVLNNNESLNVTNVNSLISLAPGEFRVYANSAAALSTEELLLNDEFSVYPNPIKNTFKINLKVDRLIIYDVNGKKVKEFKGEFEKNHSFETNHLKTGLYFLEVRTKNGKAFKKIVIE